MRQLGVQKGGNRSMLILFSCCLVFFALSMGTNEEQETGQDKKYKKRKKEKGSRIRFHSEKRENHQLKKMDAIE